MNQLLKERADLAHQAWHELALAVVVCERSLRGLGHVEEADHVARLMDEVNRCDRKHCDRIRGANGHHKDSTTPATELPGLGLAASEDAGVARPALADENGAADGGSIHTLASCPDVDDEPGAAAAPVSGVVSTELDDVVQRRIDELTPREQEDQRYEVAIKMLYRARSILARGTDDRGRPTKRVDKIQLAWKLVHAAQNVLEGGAKEIAL